VNGQFNSCIVDFRCFSGGTGIRWWKWLTVYGNICKNCIECQRNFPGNWYLWRFFR